MEESRKPAIRFKGFTDDWEQRKLDDNLIEYKETTTINNQYPALTSSRKGIFLQTEYFAGNQIASENNTGYNVVPYGYFTYRHMSDDEIFHFNINDIVENGIVSTLYPVFTTDENLDSKYLQYQLNNGHEFSEFAVLQKQGGSRTYMYLNKLKQLHLTVPVSIDEQKKIAVLLEEVDNLITLHQRKYDKLVNIKKSMLEKMFPKDGEVVPEIRFEGFTDDWEQRKFSELVQIERGGSPRPIDDYITDNPNGLNWVKIGDAPQQGHYITKTTEKIKPEGLSKTREVHPGDLILSNSMSFGKPYIMGIDGCIHDGWLLIRDNDNIFDLTFLCHLLGTPQMLNQYRSFAAGSTVNNLNKELVGNTIITIPKIDEQQVLGQYLENIDNLITLHQRKLEKLQNIKKSMLERMFV
ncbi:MAG: restriction endonuclease subunit S [Peptococcaceae bacterium]|nr:restriction endonuclease subunit S [Peptococcaceae bacterium]